MAHGSSTPAGASLGGDFVAGQALNAYGNLDREHARLQRWRAGVQKELGRNMAIEVAYVGTYSDDVDVSSFLGNTNNTQASVRQDILPSQYWNHTDTRNAALATENNRNVPNPFFVGNLTALRASNPALYNQLAAQALFTSPTIQKNRLLRPYPHMSVGATVFRLWRCRSARFARTPSKWRSSGGSLRVSASTRRTRASAPKSGSPSSTNTTPRRPNG